MGRSDDSISRRRNKKVRKKQDNKTNSSSKVSARITAIIAAKNRRKTGKRRNCQGMCFSLPTSENPFNDKHEKELPTKKRKRGSEENKKRTEKNAKVSRQKVDAAADIQEQQVFKFENVENGKSGFYKSFSFMGPEIVVSIGKPTFQIINRDGFNHAQEENGSENIPDCPSKFFITCLNSIQNALEREKVFDSERDQPLLASSWGLEFWNYYSCGKDVLETDESDSTPEQIAWIAATAADSISMKEKEGQSLSSPFLLYLVPSQEIASKVRQICKPLKARGIHTVSLHPSASLDHQIHGLKTCEPEYIVATPERFLELLNLRAVDASNVSLLVISGLEFPFTSTYFDTIKAIRQFISGNPRTVVFSRCLKNSSSAPVVQNRHKGSVSR